MIHSAAPRGDRLLGGETKSKENLMLLSLIQMVSMTGGDGGVS